MATAQAVSRIHVIPIEILLFAAILKSDSEENSGRGADSSVSVGMLGSGLSFSEGL